MALRRCLQLVFTAALIVASRALLCCTPLNSFPESRSCAHKYCRLDTSISSSLTYHEQTTHDDKVQVFLRFSPLIGGPPIPLHVEVILAEDDADKRKNIKSKEEGSTIYIRKTNNLASMAFLNTYQQLHRLDFLPENPTDPSTVIRLASLQSVPGKLRHRCSQTITPSSDSKQDGRGISVLLPVGSIPCSKEIGATSSNIISTALEFTNERRDNEYDDLRILLGKNCLSFALDLLLELNNVHGIQRVDSWNKIDFGE
eukprot:CAMPEP_0201739976 /NCGR_PEP_ID=MMETSP0593-20130828/46067_1 /ASSEMBLY_ACC=CAM_ASM_000672 /TAXON_ID=267983 /ORGANISM="Skeletonema japonicum, Strain CCMP2506" /LENGTH=256 /DNA_ID=CAMNT_0048234275 /DNA_START=40 /DNA_END=810 /DNA_ORIENTATION=+